MIRLYFCTKYYGSIRSVFASQIKRKRLYTDRIVEPETVLENDVGFRKNSFGVEQNFVITKL
jgi:hypothetical protein